MAVGGEIVEQAIQLFGYLILTFLAVPAPILVILLSIFREGRSKLTIQYENERFQSEKNIRGQLKKIGEAEKADVEQIQQSLYKLKAIKKGAQTKLSYLNPKKANITAIHTASDFLFRSSIGYFSQDKHLFCGVMHYSKFDTPCVCRACFVEAAGHHN